MTGPALLLALLLAAPAGAQPPDHLLAQGDALYEEGDYRGALAAYDGAAASGWTSPTLLLNASAAALRAGDLPRARLAAERAARLAPRDADVRHNLALVRAAVGEPPERPNTASAAAVAWLAANVGAAPLAAGALVAWLALFALLGLRVVHGGWPTTQRRLAMVVGPLALLAIVAAFAVSHHESAPRAVALAEEAPLARQPGDTREAAGYLRAGQLVRVGASRGAWRHVRAADGTAGWVETATMAEL
jgi:tetratricopeptide (TPR) repeat protein